MAADSAAPVDFMAASSAAEGWPSASALDLPTLQSSAPAGENASPVLPEKKVFHQGLAAMVVNQSEKEAPPLNRRAPTSPFPATSSESLLARGFHDAISAASVPVPPAPSVPVAEPVHAPESSRLPDTQPLQPDPERQELQEEIEQVKNDLFGAVMGVSALKDRLDGLEAQLSRIQSIPAAPAPPVPAPPPGPSRSEVETLISSWMETHLSASVERLLAASQEQMMSSLSTLAFFRASTPFSGTDRQSFLARPPVILTATPV